MPPDEDADAPFEHHAAEGLGHLQAAARELIAAARAVLDAAEDLVDDPSAVSFIVDTVGTVVRGAASQAWRPPHHRPTTDGEDDGGVQRIRVK